MEFCAFSVLDAVGWPWSALGFEGAVVWWVPVSREYYRGPGLPELLYVLVQSWDDLVTFSHFQSTAWAEIVLNINNYERRVFVNFKWQSWVYWVRVSGRR